MARGLERVGRSLVLERCVVGVPEVGVVVEGDLAVEGDDRAVRGLHQRVDLDEGRVLGDEDGPQLLHQVDDLLTHGRVEARGVGDLARPWRRRHP